MMSRRYPTAEEVERILWDLERPMTIRQISRVSGVRYDHVKFAMTSLLFQKEVRCRHRKDKAALWSRRRCQ